MAELDFIMTDEEQRQILNNIIGHGGKCIPSLWYNEPQYEIMTDIDIIMQLREQMSGPIFIVWDDIFEYPLEFIRVPKKEGVFYFLNQKHGGPYIDFLPCRRLQTDAGVELINGFVAYYPEYIVGPKCTTIDIPYSLKSKYREILKMIKSISTKLATDKITRYYWVSNEVIDLIRKSQVNNTLGLVL